MELLIKKRSPVRGSFTKNYNALMKTLAEENPQEENIKVNFANLERIFESLAILDNEICAILLDSSEQGSYEIEYNAIEEYNEKMVSAKVNFELFLSKNGKELCLDSDSCSLVTKKKLKLPKIELIKFSSELKDWLPFWSQFKRIHEDNEIENEDKFQYLIQCVAKGTRAREIVDSFPPTSENYGKAIESLRSRFGRDELLIEFYVRQLLQLVVQNATGARNKMKISSLYDKLESYLRALESIGLTSDKYAAMLFPLVESCIPEDLFRVWLRNSGVIADDSANIYSTKLKGLLSFLKTEVEGDERIRLAQSSFEYEYRQRKEKSQHFVQPTANDLFSGTIEKKKINNLCIFCDKLHDSKECFYAQTLNWEQKQEILRNKKCCFLCLKMGHRSKFCKTHIKCVLCSKKHYVLMCPELPANKITEKQPETTTPKVSLASHCVPKEVLLQTLIVKLKSKGKIRQVRVLIDSGSQQSYILESTAENLDLDTIEKKSFVHSLFGGFNTQEKNHNLYKVNLEALSGKFSCDIEVLDQPKICSKIPRLQKGSWNKELQENKIWIADYGENCPDIELLIGADFCGQLFTGRIHKLKCGLIACETLLGWLVMGKVPGEKLDYSSTNVITSLFIKNASIANLWEMDIIGIKDPVETKSREEMETAAVEHFSKTFSINRDGRYEVHLPWKEEANYDLNDHKGIAEKRLISTSLKLLREGKYNDYNAVFKDWEESGIIEIVSKEEMQSPSLYLPHRAVIKENSTTKIRPVFDASCREKGCLSLNDCLEKGPNLLEEIPPILMRFRMDKIGVVADIKKAFLQISVSKEDCDYLRFLWWEDFEKREMKVYRHRRVVFGLTCSPFLLAAVLNTLIEEAPIEMKETADILGRSFYVDNCVTSLPNEEKMFTFINQSRNLLEKACFDLRGWEHSNFYEVTNLEKPISVLGLQWDKNEDTLFCDVTSVEESKKNITKRNILSTVSKIFDPLGILCPVTVIPKLIVQETWNLKMGWDVELPEEIRNKFEVWRKDLELLSSIKIARCLDMCQTHSQIGLHVFTDASKLAYCAVVFLRKVEGEITSVHLIQAKTRIAPLRKMSIPRLELLACCIGARLAHSVIKAMNLQDIPVVYWSDSSTALSWIKRNEYWGIFVNNRVKEIRALSNKDSWRHVPGDHNPADLPSRGCSIRTYLKSKWWEGPLWLRKEEGDWPKSEVQIDEEEVLKEKRKGLDLSSTLLITEEERHWYNKRFSKYSQILRMIAWILRFANNSLERNKKITGELLVNELELAEKKLVKIIQQDYFKESESQTQLKSLCTFLDDEGLLRLKTKITRRTDEENFLCPIILPSKNDVVNKLIHERHLQLSHAGTQAVLTNIRQQFWILRGRKTVQRVISKCVRCRRHAAKGVESIPTPLPEDRTRDTLVFEVTGLDLAGPLYLKNGEKLWILLFTCAVYRAVHLELLKSVSTNCFLLGLRRFIARRGRPKIIYSDNGSNFVGASNLMAKLNWDQVIRDTSIHRIQWKFNPPAAPWWGGWWERIVQMVKSLLKKVLGKASLEYEEILTILCDVEAVINARPLTYISDDPRDLVPLSPSLFIQDIRTVGVPDLDRLDEVNISKRLRYQQRLRKEFRRRFRDEYLSLLIQSPVKKKHLIKELKIDDIVLVKCDNKKRIDWPLGRVIAVFPGHDNCVRVVKVKTINGELTRPVQNLYPLEISCSDKLCEKANIRKTKHVDSRVDVIPDSETVDAMPDVTPDSKSTNQTRCGRKIRLPKRYED